MSATMPQVLLWLTGVALLAAGLSGWLPAGAIGVVLSVLGFGMWGAALLLFRSRGR
ncbi:MAG TPA: hypothetical protein VFS37_13305 [Conexibacter sp.]|nr:hypothetical protein [Conexibacter sp.]